jgi:PIN domain nuclease of toxin-antitoxin system
VSHLDSYALIAYLRDEPAAEEVERLLREGAAMSAVAVAEVVDHLARLRGRRIDEVEVQLRRSGDGRSRRPAGDA